MPTPEAVAPPPGNPRFPLVDSLRAIAALAVIAGHILLVALGARVPGIFGALGSGVTVFFVISGFLLYRPYVAARLGDRDGPRVRQYARRRMLRILPAYWLALTVLSIYPGLEGNFGHDSWIYYGLLQYWFPHLQTHGLPQAWSLSVEATWYLGLPMIGGVAWAFTRARRRASALGLEIGLLAGLAAIRLVYEGLRTPALDTAFYYLDWFLAGMALAVLSAACDQRRARPRAVVALERHPNLCWLAAFGTYCTFAFRLAHHPPTFGDHLAEGLFALLIVAPAVFVGSGQGLVRAVLRNRLLAWLGLVSYGLYLWHVPILLKLGQSTAVTSSPFGTLLTLTALTLSITVACASFSYYLLERPLLRFKSARGGPPVATESARARPPLSTQH